MRMTNTSTLFQCIMILQAYPVFLLLSIYTKGTHLLRSLILRSKIIDQRRALGIRRAFRLEEIRLDHIRIRVLADPAHAGRLAPVVLEQEAEPQTRPAQIAQVADIVRHHLSGQARNVVPDHIVSPVDFLAHPFLEHFLEHRDIFRTEQRRLLFLQFENNVAEQP